jgi:hypothetical protein
MPNVSAFLTEKETSSTARRLPFLVQYSAVKDSTFSSSSVVTIHLSVPVLDLVVRSNPHPSEQNPKPEG